MPDPSVDRVSLTGLNREHLLALGEVAFWAAKVERTMAEMAVSLLTPETSGGYAVVETMQFAQIDQLIVRLLKQRQSAFGTEYAETIKAVREAMKARNSLLHGYWDGKFNGGTPLLDSIKNGIDRKPRAVPLSEVQGAANELLIAHDQLFVLWLRVMPSMLHPTGQAGEAPPRKV